MDDEEKLQRIDDYLNGNLSEEQKFLFRKQIEGDDQLVQEVEGYRDMIIGFERAIDKELKLHFVNLEQQAIAEEKVVKETAQRYPSLRKFLPWVGGIAACLLLTLFLLNFNKPEKLYNQYYQPYIIAAIERNETAISSKDQALQAYEDEDYLQTSILLEKELKTHPQDVDLYFYLGITYLELNQLGKAIESLTKVQQAHSVEFSRPTHWYLALAYLKNNEVEKAKPHLQSLSREKGVYYTESIQLLQEL